MSRHKIKALLEELTQNTSHILNKQSDFENLEVLIIYNILLIIKFTFV